MKIKKYLLAHYFITISGVCLALTGVAKVISAEGHAGILRNNDPIFMISFGQLFLMAGIFELFVAGICLFSNRVTLQAALIAWLSCSFIIYRLGLRWVNYRRPCPCLGNLTDALHIPPRTADVAMNIILAYLFVGSWAILLLLWLRGRRAMVTSVPAQ